MLRKITQPTLSLLSRLPKATIFNSVKPCYNFATGIQSFSNLRGILEKEIKYEQENAENLTEFTNFFESNGFKVSYDGLQVELAKKSGVYNIRVLFQAKTPISQENQEGEEQQQQEEGGEDTDYGEITAFIKKDGSSKWFALDFAANTKETQLTNATFIDDYEAEKAERKKGRYPPGYLGPDLSSLDESLENGIYEFIEGVGVNSEILGQAYQFSIAYEHQFYVKWLKDLKSLV